MTTREMIAALNLKIFHEGEDLDREITGCYSGDLLSWVMGRATAGQVWCTIMSNQNVAAVAVLSDLPCILLTEGVSPDDALMQKAGIQDVTLLGTDMATFDANVAIGKLLGK